MISNYSYSIGRFFITSISDKSLEYKEETLLQKQKIFNRANSVESFLNLKKRKVLTKCKSHTNELLMVSNFKIILWYENDKQKYCNLSKSIRILMDITDTSSVALFKLNYKKLVSKDGVVFFILNQLDMLSRLSSVIPVCIAAKDLNDHFNIGSQKFFNINDDSSEDTVNRTLKHFIKWGKGLSFFVEQLDVYYQYLNSSQ